MDNITASVKHIQGPTYSVDIEWHKEGHPVIYCKGHGKSTSAREALNVIGAVVDMINASSFDHVCAVYNMLELTHMPMLARFVRAGNFPSASKTAHIIIGTHSQSLQLVTSLVAILASKRLRTMEACTSEDEIEQAVKRWLMLPERTRSYVVKET